MIVDKLAGRVLRDSAGFLLDTGKSLVKRPSVGVAAAAAIVTPRLVRLARDYILGLRIERDARREFDREKRAVELQRSVYGL